MILDLQKKRWEVEHTTMGGPLNLYKPKILYIYLGNTLNAEQTTKILGKVWDHKQQTRIYIDHIRIKSHKDSIVIGIWSRMPIKYFNHIVEDQM